LQNLFLHGHLNLNKIIVMELKRTFDIVDLNIANHQKEDALAVKRNGKWEKFSTKQYKEFVDAFSYGLLAMGYKKGDKIVTVSNNRPEWNFMDNGMTQIGAVHVPIYANQGLAEYEHILSHSDARIVIVSSKEFYDKIKEPAKNTPKIENIYCLDEIEGVKSWMEIIELGRKEKVNFKDKLVEIKNGIGDDELMSIIYTSGTTGLSKGVMLSHRNFVQNLLGTIDILPVEPEDKFLSFLPLCHVFERMVNYLVQYRGCAVYYAESIETVGDNIREVNPQGFAAVPRVIENFMINYIKREDLKGIKKSSILWAVNLGLKYELNEANGALYEFQLKIANKIILVNGVKHLVIKLK